MAGLDALPSNAPTLTKLVLDGGVKGVGVKWTASSANTLPIFGYKLYSDMGGINGNDVYSLIYDGSHNPSVREYVLNINNTSVTKQYKFKVAALNINGQGTQSSVLSASAC